MKLPLFADAEYTAVLDHLETDPSGSRVWKGRLAGYDDSAVLLVVGRGALAGRIRDGERLFRIRYIGAGRHRIEELALGSEPLLDTGTANLPASSGARGLTSDRQTLSLPIPKPTSEIAQLDLMALYTRAAERRAGGKKAIRSLIRLHVEVANQALANSRAKARIRLVETRRVAYRESDSMGRDLANVSHEGDGEMERVFALRDRYGADFVTLYVDRPRDRTCGYGYLGWSLRALESGSQPSESAFSVVRPNCPDRTLGHEIGHNMGMLHGREDYADPHQADEWGAFDYAYGFKYRGESDRFRTMMALSCSRCRPLLSFANPRVREGGVRTGVGRNKDLSADVVRSINRIRDELAAFRPCRVDCEVE